MKFECEFVGGSNNGLCVPVEVAEMYCIGYTEDLSYIRYKEV